MKKCIFSMAVLAAMVGTMTSCSNDEEVNSSNNAVVGKAISFNVNNGSGTRALGTTPGNYLTQVQNFQVWGYYADGATGTGVTPGAQYVGVSNTVGVFMDGDGAGAWNYRTASDASYWPAETAPLNFQAITPASDASFTIENTPSGNLAHVVANVTVPTDNAAQKDIMFASTPNQKASSNSRKVNLSFQHAMSQITFSAKLASTKFTAEVSGISINNIKSTGKVGYLAENDAAGAVVLGGGADASMTVANYATGMVADGTVDDISTAKTLTADDGALIMLPQTTVKWATVDGTPVTVAEADAAKNSYLVITCKIKTTDGTYLVGSDSSFGTVYVPFAANWERSKKYNYTIVFGTGTGGFDADGNLIFQPISYSASVEDWTPVDGGQLDS